MIPKPVPIDELSSGFKLIAGHGVSTVLPDFDFETYSPAGFIWDPLSNKFKAPEGAMKKGLPATGVAVYSEHPDAEVLSCAYDLKDGAGKRLWTPESPPPTDLLNHVVTGGILEAWNSMFEHWIWNNVCVRKYGWPRLSLSQLRDAAAKSRAFGLPGSLDAAGEVLKIQNRKDKDGKRLLEKFSWPRNPTLANPRTRITPTDDPQDAKKLYEYNIRDIMAEAEISSLVPDLPPHELEFWLCDQAINYRGVAMDIDNIHAALSIVEQAHKKYNTELRILTGGEVKAASEIQRLRWWLASKGVYTDTLGSEIVAELLMSTELSPAVRRVLEIRDLVGSASVKKLYSMKNQITSKGRIHDIFIYHGAHTGRTAGVGVQPQNLPNSGIDVNLCTCGKHFCLRLNSCPWCGVNDGWRKVEWNPKAVEDAFEVIKTKNLECLEYYFGNAIATISGCIRGLFIAAPGHDLLCSDYSAIEAVVLAVLAGEEWRMEVFRTHGKIYEMSASKITGVPFEEFELYKSTSGSHHPLRKKVGKVAELASGYQGWVGAWKQFGADEFFDDEEIKKAILAWRAASPRIVEFWGGQQKRFETVYYGMEGMAIQAVRNPGNEFSHRDITYFMRGDVLYCRLLSGRCLAYHRPRLVESQRRPGTLSLSYEKWNTNPKNGGFGWIRIDTYGGKLTENVVQATARDILTNAIVNLEKSGYPVVMHVHDEIVCEVPEGVGSVEQYEAIMATMPTWASDWPIKASGGWRAKRYAK